MKMTVVQEYHKVDGSKDLVATYFSFNRLQTLNIVLDCFQGYLLSFLARFIVVGGFVVYITAQYNSAYLSIKEVNIKF